MTALAALGIAILALVLSSAGIWALVAWRKSESYFDELAERLYVDCRLERLTAQTLSAMHDAVRRGDGAL